MQANQLFQIPNDETLINHLYEMTHQELIDTFNHLQENFPNTYQDNQTRFTTLMTLEYSLYILQRLYRHFQDTDVHRTLLMRFVGNTRRYLEIAEDEVAPYVLPDIQQFQHVFPHGDTLPEALIYSLGEISDILEAHGNNNVIPNNLGQRIRDINNRYY